MNPGDSEILGEHHEKLAEADKRAIMLLGIRVIEGKFGKKFYDDYNKHAFAKALEELFPGRTSLTPDQLMQVVNKMQAEPLIPELQEQIDDMVRQIANIHNFEELEQFAAEHKVDLPPDIVAIAREVSAENI